MSSLCHYPTLSAHIEDTEPDRIARLHETFGIMCSIARLVWREEPGWSGPRAGAGRNRWDGAVLALRDTMGQLEVVWATPQHRERYGVLAELAWEAMSESRAKVVHKLAQ